MTGLSPIRFACTLAAPPRDVFAALTEPARMVAWMTDPGMELTVVSTFEPGAPIHFRGTHHGPFENDGVVVAFEPGVRFAYTHRSSVSGLSDRTDAHATVDFALAPAGEGTALTLTVSGFATDVIRKHLQLYWGGALHALARAFG